MASVFCLLFSSFSSRGADSRPAVGAKPHDITQLEDAVREFDADLRDISRFYDLPWSEVRFDRTEKLIRSWQTRLESVRFDPLDEQGKIDYLLLRNKLAEEISELELNRERLRQMEPLLPFRPAVQALERARWTTSSVDSPAAAQLVGAIPEQIKKLRARLEKGKTEKGIETDKNGKKTEPDEAPPIRISASLARRTAQTVSEIRDTLKTWFEFYGGVQPEFSWWLKKPHEDASKALEDYAKFLREDIAELKGKDEDPLVGDPIGEKALRNELVAESIPYSPAELIALAQVEFARCEDEMKKASGELGLGDDWKAALAKVKLDYAPPGGQDELVAALSREAIRFVQEHDLVTVPPLCDETWRLTMSSEDTQKTLPYAAYGGQSMMVAYAREEMKNEDKLMAMRGNNKHFTRIVVAHELIPGHHLQAYQSERFRSYRGLFRTPFLVEGWALYWELRLWDLGYAKSPQDRIGMLFWRMHRCARIIVSLKFHLGQMTPKEMVDFLVDRVGHERLGATSEVRRYIGGGYSPLYQCSYLLGGMQLRALHDEVVKAGKMSEREFNDTVLTYNTIPIEFIRAGILNLPLTPETRTSWRFAGEPPTK